MNIRHKVHLKFFNNDFYTRLGRCVKDHPKLENQLNCFGISNTADVFTLDDYIDKSYYLLPCPTRADWKSVECRHFNFQIKNIPMELILE